MDLTALEMELFGTTKQEALSKGTCIQCKEPAMPKCYSDAGKTEYTISGLCEPCFDQNTITADIAEDEGEQ